MWLRTTLICFLLLGRISPFQTSRLFLRSPLISSPFKDGADKRSDPRAETSRFASIPVDGLLLESTFQRQNQYDQIIRSLQSHIPNLLVDPLTKETATSMYDSNFQFFVGETSKKPLIVGVVELVTMIMALRITVTENNMAVFPWLKPVTPSENLKVWTIHSKMAFNPANISSESMELCVAWNIVIPQFNDNQDSEATVQLSGRSLINISPKVKEHRLLSLKINNAKIDTSVIGDWLASIRQTIERVQAVTPNIPGFNPFALSTAQSTSTDSEASSKINVYRTPVFYHQSSTASFDDWIPIDRWDGLFPIPGSSRWLSYRRKHLSAGAFALTIIPLLVDGTVSNDAFDPKAKIIGMDRKVLLQGADKLSRLYSTLAFMLRTTSSGRLSIKNISIPIKEDTEHVAVVVEYDVLIELPGMTALLLQGRDRFALVEAEKNKVQILAVTQESLDFGDQSGFIDGAWITRRLITSIEAGESLNWITTLNQGKAAANIVRSVAPKRSDQAAKTIYRAMEALHEDFRGIFDLEGSSAKPPAAQFASGNIKFRGYMDEVLLNGRSSYIQNLGLLISSLRTSIRGGWMSCNATSLRIEFTSQGSVECTAVVTLKMSEAIRLMSGQSGTTKVEVISEYQFNDSSGTIDEHILKACRINGILTPADIVARFLRNRPALGEEDWISFARESFQWANFLNNRNRTD